MYLENLKLNVVRNYNDIVIPQTSCVFMKTQFFTVLVLSELVVYVVIE